MTENARLCSNCGGAGVQSETGPSVADREVLEVMLQAARLHGDTSEADHEIGDLQELVSACWMAMTRSQRRLALAGPLGLKEWIHGCPHPWRSDSGACEVCEA